MPPNFIQSFLQQRHGILADTADRRRTVREVLRLPQDSDTFGQSRPLIILRDRHNIVIIIRTFLGLLPALLGRRFLRGFLFRFRLVPLRALAELVGLLF